MERVNCDLILVTAKYNRKINAVLEERLGKTRSLTLALHWLDGINKPAYFYFDGMQDCDAFLYFFCHENDLYKKEYKKVID